MAIAMLIACISDYLEIPGEPEQTAMPFTICKTFEIENGHMLSQHPDKCRFPHGHSRRVEVVLEADTLDSNGMVCDFKAVKEVAADFLERFDHALCVNSLDPMANVLRETFGERVIIFPDTEPTTEVLAQHFFEEIKHLLVERVSKSAARYPLRNSVRLRRVRVWETSSSWAEFSE